MTDTQEYVVLSDFGQIGICRKVGDMFHLDITDERPKEYFRKEGGRAPAGDARSCE